MVPFNDNDYLENAAFLQMEVMIWELKSTDEFINFPPLPYDENNITCSCLSDSRLNSDYLQIKTVSSLDGGSEAFVVNNVAIRR